jgi:hypothetical protein
MHPVRSQRFYEYDLHVQKGDQAPRKQTIYIALDTELTSPSSSYDGAKPASIHVGTRLQGVRGIRCAARLGRRTILYG